MNTMKKGLIITLSMFLALFLQAQDSNSESRLHHNIDLSIAAGVGSMGSLGYAHEWGIGRNQAWRVSYGVRLSSYFGKNVNHFSAPPEFYNDEATRDTVWVENPQMNNLALFIGAAYVIKERVEIGFNIDAVGYTFGGDKAATYIGNGNETTTTVNPGSLTALLIGPNDIGMVRSDFYVGYKFSEQWKVKLGYNLTFTEYRTPTELQVGNTRYRGTGTMVLLGVTYTL